MLASRPVYGAMRTQLTLNRIQQQSRKRPRTSAPWMFQTLKKSSQSSSTARTKSQKQQLDVLGPIEPLDSKRLYRYFALEAFTSQEFETVFEKIQSCTSGQAEKDKSNDSHDPNSISREQLQSFLDQRIQSLEEDNHHTSLHGEVETLSIRHQFAETEAHRCWKFFESRGMGNENGLLTKDQFSSILKDTASSLDFKRVLPLTMSMLLVGSSVGITTPAMPFVVQNIGLTAGEYGLVVSAFALSKMTGNIPSAVLVERHGRKPYLVYTMAVIAAGVGSIGLAGSFEELFFCRLLTGLGVAGLSTAVTLTVTDISTPLNRASTFAPIMSAFAAGTALGPAIGGLLVDSIGINPTFFMVGGSYIALAAVNSMLLKDTKPKPIKFPWQKESEEDRKQISMRQSFENALGQWIPLMKQTPIRHVCIMNGYYWLALAGSQMTLLPLILTDPNGLAMTATNVGQVYMGMSMVQVIGNPVFAKVIDKVGKGPGIVGGCTLISSAMAALPFCTDLYQMAGVLGFWACGSSLLSTAPLAFISDRVDDENRAQALALLRTSGDVGFLVGASSMGALAHWAGSLDVALLSSSGILLTATGWFAARNLIFTQHNEGSATKTR